MSDTVTPPGGQAVSLACHARVSWFDIRQLSATAAKSFASTIIGSMSGRRELMAALEPDGQAHFDLAERDCVWIDYIADCGDGWNASHSVAWLAGRDALVLASDGSPTPQPMSDDCRVEATIVAGPDEMRLPAGTALILGGDQVYPTASSARYRERLEGPMRSARFHQEGGREVFAIPGNHDWYDGLTGFVRQFCQSPLSRRWLGAWETRQRRSYFALLLPHRWWLWGVDLALEDDLDPPQYEYFRMQAQKLQPGDQVILVVPTPVWLALEKGSDSGGPQLGKLALIIEMVLKHDATIPLIVTGDTHFYSHHRAETGRKTRDYVVCGGGGAFTLGTVQVPTRFHMPDGGHATETALFPTRTESAWLRWRALRFGIYNPTFTLTLLAVQLVTLYLLCRNWVPPAAVPSLAMLLTSVGGALDGIWAWLLITALAFGAFGASGRRGDRRSAPAWIAGLLHVGAHWACTLLLFWAYLRFGHGLGPLAAIGLVVVSLGAANLVFGALFGLYLVLAHLLLGMHNMEVFSAQAIEHWKCFLRIRIDRDGATVHPVGLRRSSRRWVPAPGVVQEAIAWSALVVRRTLRVPEGCQRVMDPCAPLAPELIEPPFRCGAAAGAA